MKILWIIVLFGFLAAAVEAKRKRKFEGDFEFAEEVSGDPYYCSSLLLVQEHFFVTIQGLILDFRLFCQSTILSKWKWVHYHCKGYGISQDIDISFSVGKIKLKWLEHWTEVLNHWGSIWVDRIQLILLRDVFLFFLAAASRFQLSSDQVVVVGCRDHFNGTKKSRWL